MIILGKYEELMPGQGFPRMEASFEEKPYTLKTEILEYLEKGDVHMVTASRVVDIFTGEVTSVELVYRNDERFSWSSKVSYYVEKYNLRLPREFEDHVLWKLGGRRK